ncbi:hypothetical protein BBD41_08240 [Paenibacillus ihbetae]|uniref:Uncharacterized protein n=1 Tax=Paenibacillus ihbetae TaxID=1870820 RepID=A0A1B2DY17_9BACL|nr:hypothetical protein BBD41_08240 [Paenibacillus ihbetae]OOC58476.1 hypothetical protein BBD40_22470 [Paenibacillus ihbetae]
MQSEYMFQLLKQMKDSDQQAFRAMHDATYLLLNQKYYKILNTKRQRHRRNNEFARPQKQK